MSRYFHATSYSEDYTLDISTKPDLLLVKASGKIHKDNYKDFWNFIFDACDKVELNCIFFISNLVQLDDILIVPLITYYNGRNFDKGHRIFWIQENGLNRQNIKTIREGMSRETTISIEYFKDIKSAGNWYNDNRENMAG